MTEAGRAGRQRFQLQLPKGLTQAQLQDLVALTAKAAAGKRISVIFGLTATNRTVAYWVEVESKLTDTVLALLHTSWPGVRVEHVDLPATDVTLVGGVSLNTANRPLNSDAAPAAGLVALSRSLHRNEIVHWQLMLSGARSPQPTHSGSSKDEPFRTTRSLLGLHVDNRIADARDRSDLVAKHKLALVNAMGTLAVRTAIVERDRAVIGQALAGLRSVEAPGVRLGLRTNAQRRRQRRLAERRQPKFEWPLQLNVAEAAALVGWPTDALAEETNHTAPARWLSPPTDRPKASGVGVVVGRSRDQRGREADLVLPNRARGMHLHVAGPTGVGKSTVLAHLILQDIAAGRGVVVLDPKRDLIEAVLERVPKELADRVIVFDPNANGARLGLNPLRSGNPEVATDFIVHLMRGLFARSWGPRTEDVLRTGVLSLALLGERTLVDLPRLLTDRAFRAEVQASLPAHPLLSEYWMWFEALSDSHRAEITAPLLSRLRSLLLVGPLHQVLSEPSPRFDLDVVFHKRATVLVPLSAGQLGEDAAGLLGSLVMARLWQLTQQRSRLPERARHPVRLYLDEFHKYLHLPTSMAEALAQARGLGVGLTLAHQHLDQLTPEVRSAVLANARNRIVFQLSAKDATVFAQDMAPLMAEDFKSLSSFEIYLRTVNGATVQRPVSGHTKPLSKGRSGQANAIRRASIQRYGNQPQTQPATPNPKRDEQKKRPPIGFKPTDEDESGEAA